MASSSHSYVVLKFGAQREKTPVIKRTLNPKYPAKEATFELPIYASEVERHGSYLDFVVWDKDMIGKGAVTLFETLRKSHVFSKLDYLVELSLTLNQWYRRKIDNGNPPALAFDDPANNVSP
jgi:hypothetical protein